MGELCVAYLIVAVAILPQLNVKEKLSLVFFFFSRCTKFLQSLFQEAKVTDQTVLSTKIYARVVFYLRMLWDLGGWFPAELSVV